MLLTRNEIPTGFPDNTYVSIDTEFFGQQKNKLHRPHGKFAILTICATPDFVYYITEPEKISLTLKTLDNCVWIMQNAKYDLTQLKPYTIIKPRTRLIDTMLIERILFNGYYDLFGLEHLVRRHLNEERPEKSYWQDWWQDHNELTPEAIEYSCQDASDQLKVWLEQKKLLTKTDMKIWREIDQPALWAVLDFQGFRIDPIAWKALAETNKEKVTEIDEDMPLFQNAKGDTKKLNPRSWQQTLKVLREKGFKDLKSTGEKSLRKAMRKYPNTDAVEIAKQILESRKYSTRASRYGDSFLENMAEIEELEEIENENGISLIYSDYQITGAKTGRMAASGGMHNIPIRDTKDFRKCFIARPGHKLVICDFDSQEARITGYLTQDKTLLDILKSGEKIYIVVAKKLSGKTVEKGHSEYSKAKSTFLGMDYGMTEYGLADREGMTKAEAIEYIEGFFTLFPGIEKWVNKQKQNKKVTYTVSGRKAWLNPYSGQCERNALNNPHQGTAADITKKALGYIHKNWQSGGSGMCDIPFGVVGVYHDEIVLDVPEEHAEWVRKYTEYWMVQAAEEICQGVPFKVDCSIADDWSEK